MRDNLELHNIIQVSIPLWLVPLTLFLPIGEFTELPSVIPDTLYDFGATKPIQSIEIMTMFVIALGAIIVPDMDHLAMWNKFKHNGIRDFIRRCLQNDRTRKATLVVHNYISLFVILPSIIVITYYYSNLYGFIFFTTFFSHILLDYLTDVLTLKRGSHWKINWRK